MSSAILPLLEAHPLWSDLTEVLKVLRLGGFKAVLAGGCVRDALIGVAAQDFDVATDATPEQVESLFARTVAVGKAFGVIRVLMGGHAFEVATFRKDGPYSDGRRPDAVRFSEMKDDAERRDFTINALFFDPEANLIFDFVGGEQDLKRRTIRTVGAAVERFAEDKLRPLRAVRFAAQLGFAIEPTTRAALRQFAPQLRLVSRERVLMELIKLLESEFRLKGWRELCASGLVFEIFHGISREGLSLGRTLEILLVLADREISYVAILALIFSELKVNQAQGQAWLRDLKAPKSDIEGLKVFMQALGVSAGDGGVEPMSRRLKWLDLEVGVSILSLWEVWCRAHGLRDGWISETVIAFQAAMGKDGHLPRCLLTGDDLKRLGFSPGKKMGEVLESVFDRQIEGKLRTVAEAEKFAREMLPR